MEYGQIFHVPRIGKYYCKNMKYRINIYISREISIEHRSVGLASLAQLRYIMSTYDLQVIFFIGEIMTIVTKR